MRKGDYEIHLVSSGEEALALTATEEFPVVVTDLRMPGMDGLTLMVRLRALNPDSVFLVVTGAPDLDLKSDDRIDDAITSVIAKPWGDQELFQALELAFEFHARRQSAKSKETSDSTCSVLIVHDDADTCAQREALFSGNARVGTCTRLESALVRLRDSAFDVVLTKLSLPDARGLDAVTRTQRASPHAAIVVLSEIDDDELALQALRFGAEDYLREGVSPAELKRAVRYAYERKVVERRLTKLAHYDSLTGLANRMTLRDSLGLSLARAKRHGERCALMYLDLDRFKPINDKHGHEVGDVVLQQAAIRMQASVREYDTVARLGGDEFAILFDNLNHEVPQDAAERVLASLRKPMEIGELSLTIGASGGLAIFPQAAETIDGFVHCADQAMYAAKRAGGDRLEVYARETEKGRGANST